MEFTQREIMILELALINRSKFLTENINNLPGASDKLEEVTSLLTKIRSK